MRTYLKGYKMIEVMHPTTVDIVSPGNGQVAKIANNMLLGISMIGTCEAFNLAEKLGLDAQTFFDISSTASGQCWSMTSYCPSPGPVPAAPSNRDYQPGFAVAMMLKLPPSSTLRAAAKNSWGKALPFFEVQSDMTSSRADAR